MERRNTTTLLRRFQMLTVAMARTKTQRFKPKIAPVRAKKTPSMIALDHFDFYYGPLYGSKNWPSIRLGLLTPNKFIAVLNRLSEDALCNEAILRDMNTLNVIEMLTRGKEPKPRKTMIVETDTDAAKANVGDPANGPTERESLAMRQEEGMSEFCQSDQDYMLGDLPPDEFSQMGPRSLEQDIVITGLEGIGQKMKKVDDTIIYPRGLKLFTYDRDDVSDFPAPLKDKNGISSWWLLDGSSIVPVLALNLKNDDRILDMCAAPGGKSLIMVQIGNFEQLVCNDNKTSRLGQLRRGLSMYIPVTSELNEKVMLKRKDASNLDNWDEENVYDKVLVDAPCMTDRLSVNQDEFNIFSVGMTTERLNLPQLQIKLLINAFRAAKVGGSVVYSTCTLAPTQNEGVVENAAALACQHFGIEVVEQSLSGLENQLRNTHLFRFADKCQRGSLVVPNIRSNFGPMYICKMLRTK